MASVTPSSSIAARLDAVHEYEREPAKPESWRGAKTFVAMFAGEHVAGTEFVIGPLFVMHGVSAFDFFVGLIVGNLLAVLSWALVCAPTAVRSRLTVYWQLRRIGGPILTVIFASVSALVMCVVAGAMLAVSATALAVPLGIETGSTGDAINFETAAVTVAFGIVITVVAMAGFDRLARFAKLCAPWMPLVFVAAAFATLPGLGVHSLGDFWTVAETRIFPGVPREGVAPYGFWHVAGFAWLCNATQHLGMSDLTIFRYARSWRCGFASAVGMFIGHYIAWIASGILCAAAVAQGVPTNPGSIAWLGAGWAGLVCVVLAGWTTANPTLYRAGIAFQVITPGWSRWKITLAAGILMTAVACAPTILTSLDRVLAYSGLFFLPLGACIFADMWLLPRLGLVSNFVETRKAVLGWATAVAWVGGLLGTLLFDANGPLASLPAVRAWLPDLVFRLNVDLLYLALPCWLMAIVLYLAMSWVVQSRGTESEVRS